MQCLIMESDSTANPMSTTGKLAPHIILAMVEKFDDDRFIVIDESPYLLSSSSVTELAEWDGLEVVRMPPYSPDEAG